MQSLTIDGFDRIGRRAMCIERMQNVVQVLEYELPVRPVAVFDPLIQYFELTLRGAINEVVQVLPHAAQKCPQVFALGRVTREYESGITLHAWHSSQGMVRDGKARTVLVAQWHPHQSAVQVECPTVVRTHEPHSISGSLRTATKVYTSVRAPVMQDSDVSRCVAHYYDGTRGEGRREV